MNNTNKNILKVATIVGLMGASYFAGVSRQSDLSDKVHTSDRIQVRTVREDSEFGPSSVRGSIGGREFNIPLYEVPAMTTSGSSSLYEDVQEAVGGQNPQYKVNARHSNLYGFMDVELVPR